ncbi:MAG: hypothetical protein LBU32_08600 [Clostridiales bacterium]|jgi:hypothetical protein|nr:hypothetical protein [Clostridiales bacterium]
MDTLAKLQALSNVVNAKQNEIDDVLRTMNKKAKQGIDAIENSIVATVSEVQSFFILQAEVENEIFESDKKKAEEQLLNLSIDTACPSELK